MSHRLRIEGELVGATLAAGVRELLELPWSRAKALVESGRVYVDEIRVDDPAARLAEGQVLRVETNAPRARRGVLSKEAVLHLDQDVIVVAKPAGTLTLPYDSGDRDTLVDQTRAWLKRHDTPRRGRVRRDPMVGVVQRLDKDTTGVLVFARTMAAKRALQEQLRVHSVTRRYRAIAHGEVESNIYESMIVQNRGDGLRGSWGRRSHHRGAAPEDAKRALTRVKAVLPLRGATLIECELETGRQHQIRIHLSEAGHPLVGEAVYIRDFEGPRIDAPRIMLHARELSFDHPRDGRRIQICAEPPEDFARTLQTLK